jgi:hypothetical protein
MQDRVARPDSPAQRAAGMRSATTLLLIYVSFAALALFTYRAALGGPFLSDDDLLVVTNAYLALPAPQLIPAVFDPVGEARQRVGHRPDRFDVVQAVVPHPHVRNER